MNNTNNENFHHSFKASSQQHVLMITNHGIHQWNIIPGLPDTGGQNVFVNQFVDTLVRNNFKVTIVNRGGYDHPVTGERHSALVYKNKNQRILYIEDITKAFVRKEDMLSHIDELTENLFQFILQEDLNIDLIVSHYWDGAKIASELNYKLPNRVPHVWVPHSTGSLKKRNVNPDKWKNLKVDERINVEQSMIKEFDSIAYTSFAVRSSLEDDYNYTGGLFLPPCIVEDRFFPQQISNKDEIWQFLSEISKLDKKSLQECKIISEISRTDTTKSKDILIKAFAKIHKQNPKTFLIIAIDDNEHELATSLKQLIVNLGIEKYVAPIGNEWDRIPTIYKISDIYCTPSIMEGFGMSAQEAAATRIPIVASSLVPFVTEFLIGKSGEKLTYIDCDETKNVTIGKGAISVAPNDISGFAFAISHLLNNDDLCSQMGKKSYEITIPYFTWDEMIKLFLFSVGCLQEK